MNILDNGKVLHKLRGHDKSVISLSWCPAPVNIFPKCPMNYVGPKKDKNEPESISTSLNENENLSSVGPNNDETSLNNPEISSHVSNNSTDKSFQASLKELELEKDIISEEIVNKNDQNIEATENDDNTEEEYKIVQSFNVTELKPSLEKSDEINQLVIDNTVIHPDNTNTDESSPETVSCDGTSYNVNVLNVEKLIEPNTIQKCDITETILGINGDNISKEKNSEAYSITDLGKDQLSNGNKLTCEDVERLIPKNISIEEAPRKEFLLASSAKEK